MNPPKDKIRETALRTQKNLELFENLSQGKVEYYEVTQFMNSLLGLLVFPQQAYYSKIPATQLNRLRGDGWPIPVAVDGYQEAHDLKYLLRKLRNSITHQHFEYIDDGNGEIAAVLLWDEDSKGINWKAQISVEDFKRFTYKFVELLLEVK